VVGCENSHGGGSPSQSIAYAEFVDEAECVRVGAADEVVEALYGEAVEIEVRGHAARYGTGFEHFDGVTALDGLERGGQPHGSRADNDDFHSTSIGS
jgi:hypothetical protein